ncbi:GNAT family N-acetyltransferase [Salinifilum ghardaiensis]
MSRRVVEVTLDNLDQLPPRCRRCVFWELGSTGQQAEEFGATELEKEAWVSGVLLDWGVCGHQLLLGDTPAGYAFYAPPARVPAAGAFPTAPVSADAVLLTALHVVPERRRLGLGTLLVRNVARELSRRGVRAVEAFADAAGERSCVIPAEFLQRVGFHTVRAHEQWPRMRMELPEEPTWKADVDAALQNLTATMTVSTARPHAEPSTCR